MCQKLQGVVIVPLLHGKPGCFLDNSGIFVLILVVTGKGLFTQPAESKFDIVFVLGVTGCFEGQVKDILLP